MPAATRADVVIHDNRAATFVLRPDFDSEGGGTLFDPTLPPSAQPSIVLRRSLIYAVPRLTGSAVPLADAIFPADLLGVQIAVEAGQRVIVNQFNVEFGTTAAQAFLDQELVDPSDRWALGGALAWNALFQNPVRQPLLGQSPTIGFRSPVPGGFQYGFIRLNWQLTPRVDGAIILMYQPIEWAYETQTNVPILVPAPGPAFALIALAPLALRRRRGAREQHRPPAPPHPHAAPLQNRTGPRAFAAAL
ncbi:MAG: hypothetical protein ACT4PL_01660 [Phycisphaerales bacterium]